MLRAERDLVLAIEPECYQRWLDDARLHVGDAALLEQLRSPEAAARLQPTRKVQGDIAVINLTGFITQKPSLLSMLFGGTSAQWFAETVQAAMADPAVGAVVLNIDSPGGSVFGLPEAAAVIRTSRGAKPLKAIANPFAASGGYYLAAQADEVIMLPSGVVGSIGVKVAHVDESEALKKAGLSVTEITYGRRKVEESSARPLTDEARESIQARVDYYGKLFEEDVAKGRRVSVAEVRAKYGEGAMFTADGAKTAGLVDRIATLEQVLAELTSGGRGAGVPKMETEPDPAQADPVEMAARAALAGVRF